MKSFGSYISKYLVSFVAFILILLFLNAVVFGLTFQKIVTEDYGDSSPQAMLEMTATAATPEQLSDEAVQMLRQNHIWAIYLNTDGQCYWSVDLPDNVPKSYTIQDVALFSKGYIEDYPVFIWNTDDGLLVLGYGLGLLIVQQVAIAHNGTFKLTNVFPKGCEAALIFPYIG